MDISLSNNEEILMNLLTIIPIVPICKDIIQFKNKMEKEDTLNYHVERWVTISSKYFRSFEMIDNKQIYRPSDISPFSIDTYSKIHLSYRLGDEIYGSKYASNADNNLDYFHETGISYQVREFLLNSLNTKEWKKKHWKDIRKHDDVIYGPLSKKIMENTKKKYKNYLKYIPKNNLD